MLTIPPAPFRRPGKRQKRKADAPPPVAPLVLMTATFDSEESILVLQFDRAIDIAGLDGSLIRVNDPVFTDEMYVATGGAEQVTPEILQLFLNTDDASSGSDVTLTAAAGNGIKAAGDAGVWAGVVGLILPFP